MGNNKSRGKCAPAWNVARPAIIGLLTAFAIMLALIAVFSLFFLMIESIAKSAVIPLALVAAAVGCFFGAFICVRRTGCGGVILGAVIGAAMFIIIWLASMLGEQCVFGSENIIKIFLLVGCGGAGGYMGGKRKRGRR